MEAKELRIGNYVSRLDLGTGIPRKEQILELLLKRSVTTGPCRVIVLYEDVKPIPLTEEWLLRMGFEKSGSTVYININRIEIGTIASGKRFYIQIGLENVTLPIKHVHQLQNLYFALTGCELEIK